MGRHKKSIERPLMPDVKYNSKVISKFVCRMMLDGKKDTCLKIVYQAMDNLKAKTDKDPLEVLLKALENVNGSNVRSFYNIVGGNAQAIEFNVRAESNATGIPLYKLRLKKNHLLCCISRGGKVIIPSGRDEIKVGDTVVVVTTNRSLNDLKDILE